MDFLVGATIAAVAWVIWLLLHGKHGGDAQEEAEHYDGRK